MRRKQSGLSLIEVLLAMVILAVAFLALMQIFPSAYLTVYRSKDQLVALQLAQSYMDETRASAYSSMLANSQFDVPIDCVMNDVNSRVSYHVIVQVAPLTPAGASLADSDSARIMVQVQWTQKSSSGTGMLRYVRVESSRLRDS